jgi:hypothetical protein
MEPERQYAPSSLGSFVNDRQRCYKREDLRVREIVAGGSRTEHAPKSTGLKPEIPELREIGRSAPPVYGWPKRQEKRRFC